MRTFFSFLIVLFFPLTINITTSDAQESPQWHLPEGASARLGKGTVEDIAYSPDGSRLAVAGGMGIWIYDASTGAEVAFLAGHTGYVDSVAYSPDGNTIASGGNGEVRLWHATTGTLRNVLRGHTDRVYSVAFSPDGRTIASGSRDDTVRLWDMGTGTLKNTIMIPRNIYSVAFSPDGRTIAGGTEYGGVFLWNTITGSLVKELEQRGQIHSVTFSPDGNTIASGSSEGPVRLWDAETGNLKNTLYGEIGGIYSVVYSSDGSTLATAGHGAVILWDAVTGNQKNIFTEFPSYRRVRSVAFSPNGTTLAGGSEDGTVVLWNTMTNIQKKSLTGHTSSVYSVAFSPDGSTLATAGRDGAARLWDTATGNLKDIITVTDAGEVYSVAYSPDGTTLTTAGTRAVRQWDVATGTLKNTISEGGRASPAGVAYSPDGNTLAIWALRSVSLYDVATGDWKGSLNGHTEDTGNRGHNSEIVFSPDGRTIAGAGGRGKVFLWDAATGRHKSTLIGHPDWGGVHGVAYSPDGSTIASSGSDRTVFLWDLATFRVKSRLRGYTDHVFSMAFSPDGTTLAGGNSNGTVVLWDVATGRHKNTLLGHTDYVNSIAYSPDGSTLASASWDGTVLLWELIPAPPESETIAEDVNADGVVNIVAIADTAGAIEANVDGSYTVGGIVDDTVPSPIVIFTTKPTADPTTYASVKLVQTAADGTETVTDGENDSLNVTIDVGMLENGTYMFHALAVDESGDVQTDASPQVRVHVVNFRVTDISGLAVIAVDGTEVSEPPTEPISVRESVTVSFTVANGALAAKELNGVIDGSNVLSESAEDPENIFSLKVMVAALPKGVHILNGAVTKRNGLVAFPLATINTHITDDFQTDVNDDGIVNIQDLVLVAANLGQTGENVADVNSDGVVNIQDLVLVAAALGQTAAAPSVSAAVLEHFTASEVEQWLEAARHVNLADPAFQRGIRFLEQLRKALIPKETALLVNYPNPFNPETWIPYQLAKSASITISIHSADGTLVRRLTLGNRSAGIYQSRSRAAYWDGRNEIGESVASGVYFYTLSAGDFTATRKMLIRK